MADFDRATLRDIVQRAGERALALWADGEPAVRHWEKAPGQPVSDADLTIDRMLRAELGLLLPDAGWLSEETADDGGRLSQRRVWVVDPIDGTKDYLAGRPGWSVSVALVDRGQVVAALLSAPARQELWEAYVGEGAYCNGHAIHASDQTELEGARVPADALTAEDAGFIMVERPNSIALRMAMVAAGKADLVATMRWGNEWDIAAAALIAREAGASITDALGQPLRFNRPVASAFGVLCSAPGIYDAALQRLSGKARVMLSKAGSRAGSGC